MVQRGVRWTRWLESNLDGGMDLEKATLPPEAQSETVETTRRAVFRHHEQRQVCKPF